MPVSDCCPKDVFDRLSKGEDIQLVDVREPDEYSAVKVEHSLHLPLSRLSQSTSILSRRKDIYLLCRSGKRADTAAQRLEQLGFDRLHVVKGGLDAWVRSDLPVEGTGLHVWPLERQVRFTAGLLVLVGIILSYSINSNWIFLSCVVALGMVMSAMTGTCGMANVLRMMPWNCQHQRQS